MVPMASRNPAFNEKIFQKEIDANRGGGFSPGWGAPADEVPPGLFEGGATTATGQTAPGAPSPISGPGGDTMRLGGTLSASAVLLGLVLVGGWFGWQAVKVTTTFLPATQQSFTDTSAPGWLIPVVIGALIVGVLTGFKPKLARFTGPIYAIAQGAAVGAISHIYDAQYDGIVIQAVGLTIGVFVMMLVLYSSGAIRVTDKLRKGVIAATGAVVLIYLVSLGARLIFNTDVPMIHESGPVGILFSLVVVGIASMNLLLDFDFIEKGVAMGAPRYMEWFGAFGLIVSLIWLYLELLRLLSKLRSR